MISKQPTSSTISAVLVTVATLMAAAHAVLATCRIDTALIACWAITVRLVFANYTTSTVEICLTKNWTAYWAIGARYIL
jgi:hypothetical protein